MATIVDGIIIGGAGGAIAGLTVWLVQYSYEKVTQRIHARRIFTWLKANTVANPDEGDQFKSTRAIASWNNLTEERVRFICSIDNRVFLSTGPNEGMWGIYERVPRSVYE
ncbi:hypothetical protein GCM10007392_22360 [Saccharospirillum salsuginis]|uniref:Uncharacterized protein n=1 Tax=Saccharospirillum salsuginis TaxID=418750 RepID=A0A918KA52_9GAMM|nr:hypothetical protein GCM10007392_22360 [Saccharospirillum salsuginis]